MDFLFENPIFLIIVIGLISSLYKQLKRGVPEDGKQHPRGPFTQTTQPINSRPVERKKMVNPVVGHKPLNDVLLEVRKTVEQIPNKQPLDNRAIVKQVSVRHQDTSTTTAKNSIKESTNIKNKSRLIDGVILSKVLGPPRSKKPHPAMKPTLRVRN